MKDTKWIVATGLDGSGKTTLVEALERYYTSLGKSVKRSRLPFDRYIVKELLDKSTSKYTDRMLFALDNRLFAEEYEEWFTSDDYDIIITQRGFLDSFVHGAVQGFGYDFIADLNRIDELPKCDVMIHMVAEAETAYARIKDDPDADKFEYLSYIRRQEQETRRAYRELVNKEPSLEHFHSAQNIYVDTTQMTTEETFEYVLKKLKELGF